MFLPLLLGGLSFSLLTALRAEAVSILSDSQTPQIVFAVDDIESALFERGRKTQLKSLGTISDSSNGLRIVLADLSNKEVVSHLRTPVHNLSSEGYGIRKTKTDEGTTLWVIGADTAGVMYGGLELAEVIRTTGLDHIQEEDASPYMAMRGVKFNCPLDVRTPSYSDVSDSAQHNIPEVWKFSFWQELIDNLARHRFNFISLWSLHPFPSMVKVPGYPRIALDDVQRSRVKWKEHYSLQGLGFDAPEILKSVEVVHRRTIDEKINFWRRVMRYGKERNVDFYIVTWNIFVNGTGGKYGITDSIENETTQDYFRQSVRQLFLTYPDLRGVGLTTGENMPGARTAEKEDWAYKTYALGVLDAASQQPGRKITFIHRQHQTGALDIARKFKPLVDHPDIEFIFSFKYAKAHVYSSTIQTFHPEFVSDIRESGDLRTIWTLRNDDIYHFRWGAPGFVRAFMKNIPHEVSRGYYYGSDQYIWGREFLSLKPENPRQLEVVKHWYQWLLWGRLGYDPELSDERFISILAHRFPDSVAPELFDAWQSASMIYPLTTGFHWGPLDFQWYIEGCLSRPGPAQTESGFHDVNRFISLGTHPGTDNISIPDYVKALSAGAEIKGTSPIEVSQKLHAHSNRALAFLEKSPIEDDSELDRVKADIRSMAWLGKYYAHKILAATHLALFRHTGAHERQMTAVKELEEAAECWEAYIKSASSAYRNPFWTNRVGIVDWDELTNYVYRDIEIAKTARSTAPD